MNSNIMVCNFLFIFFNCHSIRATKHHHFCRAGLFFPPRKIKISMHWSQEARDFKNHHRPPGLHAFHIRSSVLTTAEYKTTATFLSNVHFDEAAAKPAVWTAPLITYSSLHRLFSILLAFRQFPCFVAQLSTVSDLRHNGEELTIAYMQFKQLNHSVNCLRGPTSVTPKENSKKRLEMSKLLY